MNSSSPERLTASAREGAALGIEDALDGAAREDGEDGTVPLDAESGPITVDEALNPELDVAEVAPNASLALSEVGQMQTDDAIKAAAQQKLDNEANIPAERLNEDDSFNRTV